MVCDDGCSKSSKWRVYQQSRHPWGSIGNKSLLCAKILDYKILITKVTSYEVTCPIDTSRSCLFVSGFLCGFLLLIIVYAIIGFI